MKEADKLFSPVHVTEVMHQIRILEEFLANGSIDKIELIRRLRISRQTFDRRLKKKNFTVTEMYVIVNYIDSELCPK